MAELALKLIVMTLSFSLWLEDRTARCVVGSEPISMEYRMPLIHTFMMDRLQLIVSLSVVWLYFTAVLNSTSGHLLMEYGRIVLFHVSV